MSPPALDIGYKVNVGKIDNEKYRHADACKPPPPARASRELSEYVPGVSCPCWNHAQELRDRQAMAEKNALEAKRARVLEDMKRRQQRLQRLQEEEG